MIFQSLKRRPFVQGDGMLKLLIADDEKKVCQLIQYIVDWDALDIEIVGIVNDGEDAYREILEKRPDIVITDIRMPTYDGLELIQMTRKLFPEIAFIVISGYSQFEYAQTALRYGVVNYLLKPIKKKELEDTIIKIMEHHISKRNIENRQREIELNLKNITKNNREMLLYNLLFSSNETLRTKTMNEINLNYSCCFREGDFVVIIIKMFSVQSENSCRILHDKVKMIFENRMLIHNYEWLFAVSNNEIIYLLNGPQMNRTEIEKKLRIVYIELMKLRDIFEGLEAVLAVSRIGNEFLEIRNYYEQSESMLLDRYNVKENILCFEKEDSDLGRQDLLDMQLRNRLLDCLERLDIDSLLENIQGFQQRIIEDGLNGRGFIRELSELYECIAFGIKTRMECTEFIKREEFKEILEESYRLEDVFDRFINILQDRMHKYIKMRKERISKPIREAKNYIHQHYSEKLSLTEVSELVGFNPSYFSVLFKKETGKNFMDYVIKVRMEIAKQMLVRTNMDVYEIADRVGYSDVKYFMKLFKKNVELSAIEYRKMFG